MKVPRQKGRKREIRMWEKYKVELMEERELGKTTKRKEQTEVRRLPVNKRT